MPIVTIQGFAMTRRSLFQQFSALLLVALFTLPALAGEAPANRVSTGDTAPDFSLTDQDGNRHTLSAERGKRPVVLVFYRGHW